MLTLASYSFGDALLTVLEFALFFAYADPAFFWFGASY